MIALFTIIPSFIASQVLLPQGLPTETLQSCNEVRVMTDTNFSLPMPGTDRLTLRQLEATDDKAIFHFRTDDRVNLYLVDFRYTAIEQTHAFIDSIQRETAEGKTIFWDITQKNSNRLIGTICLRNISKDESKDKTGYILHPEDHNMGYMHEALERVIHFGFDTMKLKTIEAYPHEQNEGSIKLLLRHTFKQGTPIKEIGNNRIYFSLDNETSQG